MILNVTANVTEKKQRESGYQELRVCTNVSIFLMRHRKGPPNFWENPPFFFLVDILPVHPSTTHRARQPELTQQDGEEVSDGIQFPEWSMAILFLEDLCTNQIALSPDQQSSRLPQVPSTPHSMLSSRAVYVFTTMIRCNLLEGDV